MSTPKKSDLPNAWQFFVTFLGWLSDLLERLSDLQLGDENVTLNHLVDVSSLSLHWLCDQDDQSNPQCIRVFSF